MNQLTSNNLPTRPSKPLKNAQTSKNVQLYHNAKQHMKNGEWEAGLAAVSTLMESYPDVQELQNMHKELKRRVRQMDSSSYKKNPLYRAAMRHVINQKWVSGLILADRLVKQYPQVSELLALQKDLRLRVKLQKEARLRRRLLLAMSFLVVIFGAVGGLFVRYLIKPTPLAQLIAPRMDLNYPPHYLFSIYGADKPVGVGLSPQGDRIYVTEMGGSRLVKVFDNKGNPLQPIEIPHTGIGERAPVYVATDSASQVYITDRKQHAIFVFNHDGEYINTLIGPELTLSQYVQQTQNQLTGDKFSFNVFQNVVFYLNGDGQEQSFPMPYVPDWSPLGIRVDRNGQIYLTDVEKNTNSMMVINLSNGGSPGTAKNQLVAQMGSTGDGDGQLSFPNSALADSKGRIFISDGNNGRISVWDPQGKFLFNFGKGTGEGALSLPRGMMIDQSDRLYVVDAVGQNIKVYDVSESKPRFLYTFGDYGSGDGLFNYPNDIALDKSGRLYIVDRENNRVQVWSY